MSDDHNLLAEVHRVRKDADCLFTATDVEAALDRVADRMTERLGELNPLILVVMVGGTIPAGLLLPRLQFPLQVDYLHASRYTGAVTGGELQWFRQPMTPLRDRTVVILDDVLDEGLTLAAVVEYCRAASARSVSTAVLIEKDLPRPAGIAHADYCALKTTNRYLFGYGMDYKTYWRNANGIFAVKDR